MEMEMPALPLARYRLQFTALTPVSLPPFAGSTWRGAFGSALKRLVCVTRAPACPPCPLWRGCAYPYLFDTPPLAGDSLLAKTGHAPLPLVLGVPLHAEPVQLEPGATTGLEVTLFGHGNRYLGYLVHALAQAGVRGIGKGHGALQLDAVLQHDGEDWRPIRAPDGTLSPLPPVVPTVPACPAQVRMTLATPLRLRLADTYVSPERFRADALLLNLLRRLSQLIAHHTDAPLALDFRAMKVAAQTVEPLSATLRWHEMARWSNRQQSLLQNGGLLGELLFDGAAIEAFWPLLWLGQWTHAGKNAGMGQGRYALASA